MQKEEQRSQRRAFLLGGWYETASASQIARHLVTDGSTVALGRFRCCMEYETVEIFGRPSEMPQFYVSS